MFFFLVDVARGKQSICVTMRMQLTLNHTSSGETSERQRTAVPVVYGIECSVIMTLLWTDEAEVRHFTILLMFRS